MTVLQRALLLGLTVIPTAESFTGARSDAWPDPPRDLCRGSCEEAENDYSIRYDYAFEHRFWLFYYTLYCADQNIQLNLSFVPRKCNYISEAMLPVYLIEGRVRAFQLRHGLPTTGRPDRLFWESLYGNTTDTSATSCHAIIYEQLSRNTVVSFQVRRSDLVAELVAAKGKQGPSPRMATLEEWKAAWATEPAQLSLGISLESDILTYLTLAITLAFVLGNLVLVLASQIADRIGIHRCAHDSRLALERDLEHGVQDRTTQAGGTHSSEESAPSAEDAQQSMSLPAKAHEIEECMEAIVLDVASGGDATLASIHSEILPIPADEGSASHPLRLPTTSQLPSLPESLKCSLAKPLGGDNIERGAVSGEDVSDATTIDGETADDASASSAGDSPSQRSFENGQHEEVRIVTQKPEVQVRSEPTGGLSLDQMILGLTLGVLIGAVATLSYVTMPCRGSWRLGGLEVQVWNEVLFRVGLSSFVIPFFAGYMPHQTPIRLLMLVVALTAGISIVAFGTQLLPDDMLADPLIFFSWAIVVFVIAPTQRLWQRFFRALSTILVPLVAVVTLAQGTFILYFELPPTYASIVATVSATLYRFSMGRMCNSLCKKAGHDQHTVMFLAGVIATLAQCFIFIGQLLSLYETFDIILLNMSVGFIQEVASRMRLDTMIMNWFVVRLRSITPARWAAAKKWKCFCCKEKSETSSYEFQNAMRAWAPCVEWAPLGVHIIIFVLFGAPLHDHDRIDSQFWTIGLALYVGIESMVELVLRFYQWALLNYQVRVSVMPLKLPPLPSKVFHLWVVSCGLVAAKQMLMIANIEISYSLNNLAAALSLQ